MLKIITATVISAFSLLTLAGCIKDDSFFPTDTKEYNRRQIVKITGGGEDIQIVSRDEDPVNDEFQLIELTREPNNESELNQTLTVKLALDPTLIPEGYEALPADAYEIVGGTDVTFQPGEVVKGVQLRVDKSKMDLSKRYAIAFNIADAGGAMASNTAGQAIYEVGIKNEWHGEYQAVGVFTHPVNGPRDIDEVKTLQTVGANAVEAPLGDLGGAGYYMVLTINADNTVTITPSGATPDIDQKWGPNYYDPATQTFHLHYSYNPAAPRVIMETLTRL
jgi:hypothetical protein